MAARCPRIDGHVHIWGLEGYPEAQPSPPELVGTAEALRSKLAASGLQGALIVQPINFKFDHAPVAAALADNAAAGAAAPQLRGMALADPSMDPASAVAAMDALAGQGFVGVRFNPGLEPGWMVGPTGRALYTRCAELAWPVGIMCFSGLLQSSADIEALLAASPDTPLIIDHWGFFRQPPGPNGTNDEAAWSKLLSWAAHPAVHVKVSADFRVSAGPQPMGGASVHTDLIPRAKELLGAFGAARLIWGSDFPWVEGQEGGHEAAVSAAEALWKEAGADEAQRADIFGGTAARLFKF